jgi:hypothetical protein
MIDRDGFAAREWAARAYAGLLPEAGPLGPDVGFRADVQLGLVAGRLRQFVAATAASLVRITASHAPVA